MRVRYALLLILFGCAALGLLHAQKHNPLFSDEKEWVVYPGQQNTMDPPDAEVVHEWVWARFRYNGGGFGGFGRGRGAWSTDYNKGDRLLAQGLKRLTLVDTRSVEQVIDMDGSKDPYNWPFLYAVEVGNWSLEEEEAKQLRDFLDRGGFLMVDDFHCSGEWDAFMESFRIVFPDREVVDIPSSDPITRTMFELDLRKQIPGVIALGRGDECGGRADGAPHYRAVYDAKNRIQAAIIHNSDLGDAIEYSDDPGYPEAFAQEAFHILTNYIIYDLTH
jgi:hypothetical protein